MKSYSLTGGARIGKTNATYPFAKLIVTEARLEINAAITGNLVFEPSDIVSIEPYQEVPAVGKGIKINHRVSTYDEKIIFWTFDNPKQVIAKIHQTGFLNKNKPTIPKSKDILRRQQQGKQPLKKSVIVGFFVLWNFAIS